MNNQQSPQDKKFNFLDAVLSTPDNKPNKNVVIMNNLQPPQDKNASCAKCAILSMQIFQAEIKTTEAEQRAQKLEEKCTQLQQALNNSETKLQRLEPLLKVIQDENCELRKERANAWSKLTLKPGERKFIGVCQLCKKKKNVEWEQPPPEKDKCDTSLENGASPKAKRGRKRKSSDESELKSTKCPTCSSENSSPDYESLAQRNLKFKGTMKALRNENEDIKKKLDALAYHYHRKTGEKVCLDDKYKTIWKIGFICDGCGQQSCEAELFTKKAKLEKVGQIKMQKNNINGKTKNKEMKEDVLKVLEDVMTPATSENLSSLPNSDVSLSPGILPPQDEMLETKVNGFPPQCNYCAEVKEVLFSEETCTEIFELLRFICPVPRVSSCPPSPTSEHCEQTFLPSIPSCNNELPLSHSSELPNTTVHMENSIPLNPVIESVNQDVKSTQSYSFTEEPCENSFPQLTMITNVFSKRETAANISSAELLSPPSKPCESSDKDIVKIKSNQNEERQKYQNSDIYNSRKSQMNKLENKIQSTVVPKQNNVNNKIGNSHSIFTYMETLSELEQMSFNTYDPHNTCNTLVNEDSKMELCNGENSSVTGELKDSLHSSVIPLLENSCIKNEVPPNQSALFDTSIKPLTQHYEFDHYKNQVIERDPPSAVDHKLEQKPVPQETMSSDISAANKNFEISSTICDVIDSIKQEVETNLSVKKSPPVQPLDTKCPSNDTENSRNSSGESNNLQIKVPTESAVLEKEIIAIQHDHKNDTTVTFTKKENILLSLNLLPVDCIVNGKMQIGAIERNNDQPLNESSLANSFSDNVKAEKVIHNIQGYLDEPVNDTKPFGMPALSSANSILPTKISTSKKVKKKRKWGKEKQDVKKPLPKGHLILKALEDMEFLKFDRSKLSELNKCHQLQNALINPETVNSGVHSAGEASALIMNYLEARQRTPLKTFIRDGDTTVLLPVPEKCLVKALLEVSKKNKPHLRDLVPLFQQNLLQYILESPNVKLDTLMAFCRVYAASIKFDPLLSLGKQLEFAWDICLKLVKKRLKYYPFAAISILSVWSETLSSMSLTEFDPVQKFLLKFLLTKHEASEEILCHRWEVCFKSIKMIFPINFRQIKLTHLIIETIEEVKSCELNRLDYYIECLQLLMELQLPTNGIIKASYVAENIIKSPEVYPSSKIIPLKELFSWTFPEEESASTRVPLTS